jgi:transketolase
VKIVAVGGGLAYGPQGYTHHAVEDLAVMRVLPDMTVVAPGDPVETRLATRAVCARPGPCYLRLGKANEPRVHSSEPAFEIGRAIELRPGSDVTLISTGGILETAMSAADLLAKDGIAARVISMPTVAPLDVEAIRAAARETGCVVTLEEHGAGGLGSAVAEVLAVRDFRCGFAMLRLPPAPVDHAGSQALLRSEGGLSADGIAARVRKELADL